ncbi:MAG: PAS domain S-box protein [Ectothiorhodospiraceae bacterium]|jgi:PAS domain S-box-containing protein
MFRRPEKSEQSDRDALSALALAGTAAIVATATLTGFVLYLQPAVVVQVVLLAAVVAGMGAIWVYLVHRFARHANRSPSIEACVDNVEDPEAGDSARSRTGGSRSPDADEILRAILDLSPNIVFVKDRTGRFLVVNQALADFYGTTAASLAGRRLAEVHPVAEEVAQMMAADRYVIDSHCPRLMPDARFHDAAGRLRYFRTVKVPYFSGHAGETAVLGIATDVTDLRRAQQAARASEGRNRALMEQASDAIVVADSRGRVMDVNERAESLLGYSARELLGMPVSAIHPPAEAERLERAFRDMREKGSSLYEHEVLRRDGTCVQVEVAGARVQYGADGEEVMLGIFRDVSERRRAEEERLESERRHRETLVREVHHRIKNHLQGLVGLLSQHARSRPELADALRTVTSQIHSIALVHGLQGRAAGTELFLCDMVESICRSVGSITGEPVAVDVEVDVLRPVRLGAEEGVVMALVINELVVNAVKHSRPADASAAPVHVHLAGKPDAAEIRVHNHGGQLPAEFDLQQLAAGSGLALVKSLLPRAGATLDLKNTGDGVRAVLTLSPPLVEI